MQMHSGVLIVNGSSLSCHFICGYEAKKMFLNGYLI